MMGSNGYNGYSNRRSIRVILAFIDCLLIIAGVFVGGVLRFGGEYYHTITGGYYVLKIMAIVLVIQLGFYYFDLHKLIYLRERKRIVLSLLKSLGISFLLLAILYYSVPPLAIGRGILGLSLMVIFALAFFWRLIFARICRNIIKERILIVGTKELFQKIAGDIYENGRDSFEIIGFVEERRGGFVGERSGAIHRSL